MSTKPRRTWKAIAVAVVLFFATAGATFAAVVTLAAGGLGTGSVGTSCQTSAITTTWDLTYDASVPGYTITGVTLNGLQSGCLDRSVRVVVANASGTEITSGTGTTPNSGTTATVTFSSAFTMGSPWLSQVSVMIYA